MLILPQGLGYPPGPCSFPPATARPGCGPAHFPDLPAPPAPPRSASQTVIPAPLAHPHAPAPAQNRIRPARPPGKSDILRMAAAWPARGQDRSRRAFPVTPAAAAFCAALLLAPLPVLARSQPADGPGGSGAIPVPTTAGGKDGRRQQPLFLTPTAPARPADNDKGSPESRGLIAVPRQAGKAAPLSGAAGSAATGPGNAAAVAASQALPLPAETPALPPGPLAVTATLSEGLVRVTHAANPQIVLLDGSVVQLVSQTPLVPALQLSNEPAPGTGVGFDLHVTFTNPTDKPQPLGSLTLGGIRMADTLRTFDFTAGSEPVTLDRQITARAAVQRERPISAALSELQLAGSWPRNLYSPVAVLADDRFTMGVSILYPGVSHRHGVTVVVGDGPRMDGDGGPWWYVQFRLDGTLAPGGSQHYVLAVRFAPPETHWLTTLLPYREHFRSLYGPVQHRRDPRPVLATVMADSRTASPSNPRAFLDAKLRPDLHGFGPWVREITTRRNLGFARTMLWAPSGLYSRHPDRNYPANTLTGLDDLPIMRQSLPMLGDLGRNMSVGYFLGSVMRAERGWDRAVQPERVDWSAEASRSLVLAELAAAAQLNASDVALAGLVGDDPAPLLLMVRLIRDRFPNLRFIAEPMPADLIHNLIGGITSDQDVDHPHLLADFINPGHETWVILYNKRLATRLGRKPTPSERSSEQTRYAELGFVPVELNLAPLPPGTLAADGAQMNLPTQLALPAGPPGDHSATAGADPSRPAGAP